MMDGVARKNEWVSSGWAMTKMVKEKEMRT
jgi:hypothetical protein